MLRFLRHVYMAENVKLTYSYYFSFLEDSGGALDEMGKMQEMFPSVSARADKALRGSMRRFSC